MKTTNWKYKNTVVGALAMRNEVGVENAVLSHSAGLWNGAN